MRVVLESLMVAGILWLASSVQSQNNSIVKLQVQMETLQASLADLPGLNTRVTRAEMTIADLARRQDADDQYRVRVAGSYPRGGQP